MRTEPEGDPLDPEEEEGGPVKSFVEHLEDLRWVIVRAVTAFGVAMLVCLLASNYLIAALKWPLRHAKISSPPGMKSMTVRLGTNHFGTFFFPQAQTNFGVLDISTNQNLSVELVPVLAGTNVVVEVRYLPLVAGTLADQLQLVNLDPAGAFYVAFKVAIYGGLLFAGPFILYYLADFILPALRRLERKYVLRGFAIGILLCFLGVSFCFFIMMPIALRASVAFSQWLGFAANQWKAEDFISFECKFLLGMGLGFQMPLLLLTLVRIGVLNYEQLAGFRKYMVVLCMILGAVLTTPEVITQLMMAVPLYLLYEISVLIAWYWDRRDKKRALTTVE
jgi:sec-independent protein translocase protein TatC